MSGIEVLAKILLPIFALIAAGAGAVATHFMSRLRADNRDLRDSISDVTRETRENRDEIHRVERRMGEEFAHKSDLAELRKEVKDGFSETQKLIMELFRGRE